MSEVMRQDIIRVLIYQGARSSVELSRTLDYDPDDIYEELQRMRADGIASGLAFEDIEDGPEFDPDEDVLIADSGEGAYLCGRCDSTHTWAEVYLCARWIYTGGPVSQALAVEVN